MYNFLPCLIKTWEDKKNQDDTKRIKTKTK